MTIHRPAETTPGGIRNICCGRRSKPRNAHSGSSTNGSSGRYSPRFPSLPCGSGCSIGRRERFFVPHLGFALHFHTLAFVLLVAGTAGTLILGTQVPSVIAYLAVLTMLFLSLRRVYAEGVLKTLVKQTALVFVHAWAVLFGLMALLTVTGLTA